MVTKKPAGAETGKAAITVRVLMKRDWPVVRELFGSNGACGGCWCMHWRLPKGGQLWKESKGEKNRRDFRKLIESGEVHAVLALADGKPVGWCSFGPRPSFPRLDRSRVLQRNSPPETWSIICFFIPSRWRGRGVATQLLQAATERAFELGAHEVEGYPIVPKVGKVPAAFAWTGVPELFKRAGYRRLRRPGESRPNYVATA